MLVKGGTGLWFNITLSTYQYRKSHRGDKTILLSSYLHNGIFYTDKTASLYWIRAQLLVLKSSYRLTSKVIIDNVDAYPWKTWYLYQRLSVVYPPDDNLARFQPAWVSSGSSNPSGLNNGNLHTSVGCIQTASEEHAWVAVDLGGSYRVTSVNVLNMASSRK